MGMNDRWMKALTAIVLIFVLILVIWGVGIYFGVLQTRCNSLSGTLFRVPAVKDWRLVVDISTVAWFHHTGVKQRLCKPRLSKNAKSGSVSFL